MFDEGSISRFEEIRALERNRDRWVRRTVTTVDLSEGLDTYLEKITYDISLSRLLDIVEGVHSFTETKKEVESEEPESVANRRPRVFGQCEDLYIPVGWRARETFLDFDCKTADDRSLQLIKLKNRMDYCEWLFWQECLEEEIVDTNGVPDSLRQMVRTQIETGSAEDRCSELPEDAAILWEKIIENVKMKHVYRRIGDSQPLILWIGNCVDLTLIKLRERKTLKRPEGNMFFDRLRGRVVGSFYAPTAGCTKIIAPRDVRFKSVHGWVYCSERKQPGKLQAELHGDGSWAFCNTTISGIATEWWIVCTSRRSHLASPGWRLLLLGLVACMFWLSKGSSASTVNAIAQSFSMTLVGSVYLYYLYLLGRNPRKSFLFNWATSGQRYILTIACVIVILFPFMGHVLTQLDVFLRDVLHSALVPPILYTGYSWVAAAFVSFFAGDVDNLRMFVLIPALLAAFCDYLYVMWYGRPVRQLRD